MLFGKRRVHGRRVTGWKVGRCFLALLSLSLSQILSDSISLCSWWGGWGEQDIVHQWVTHWLKNTLENVSYFNVDPIKRGENNDLFSRQEKADFLGKQKQA